MAVAVRVRSEDQFLCSICRDVFTDPVTTSCGHNFCKSCIFENWSVNVPYQCPMCREVFNTKPQLRVNTFISEFVAQFRHEEQKAEIQHMIQERQMKIQEIQWSVMLSKNAADRQTAEGVKVFTALMKSVHRSLDQLQEEIQEKLRTTEKQAKDFIKQLEQEIFELEKRSTEVEQLSSSEDHLHFVQRFTWVKASPSMKKCIRPPSYEGTAVRAVSQLEDKLTEDIKKMIGAELKRLQRYEVDVTLDPDTAHPNLILSDDGKQVRQGNKRKKLPEKPQRFSYCCCILGKQSFSSGRFYFEVQVKGKTAWTLGVVRESINRKGRLTLCPQDGHWTIWLRNGNEYKALARPSLRLSVKSGLQKVGVFVDYEEGLVSFYDVDSSVLIHSFIGCCFNAKLLPYFSPCYNAGGTNSAPLIISPVDTE